MIIDYTQDHLRQDLLNDIRTAVLSHVENQLWESNDERLEIPSFKASAIFKCMDYLDTHLIIEFKE